MRREQRYDSVDECERRDLLARAAISSFTVTAEERTWLEPCDYCGGEFAACACVAELTHDGGVSRAVSRHCADGMDDSTSGTIEAS